MKKKFRGEVLVGHKQQRAVEVPFDPQRQWRTEPKPLWRGRRGHLVDATINGVRFESAIVARQKKFYLLIDEDVARSAQISEGVMCEIEVNPQGYEVNKPKALDNE